MNKAKLKVVKREIARLVGRIYDLEAIQEEQSSSKYLWMNPKQSGAVKRASMDLTRALAELRKPG